MSKIKRGYELEHETGSLLIFDKSFFFLRCTCTTCSYYFYIPFNIFYLFNLKTCRTRYIICTIINIFEKYL